MRYQLSEIPGGEAGTDRTIQEIVHLVNRDLAGPQLRLLATRILRQAGVQGKDHRGEAEALYRWVKRHVRYQKDPIGIETVQSPLVTVQVRAGDCDDHVALLSGLALSVGLPVRYRVVGFDKNNFKHIFVELFDGSDWFPADTTERERRFGWRPKRFPVEKLYNRKGDTMQGLAGVLPIGRNDLQRRIRASVWKTLESNWEGGLINDADVVGYLRVIDEGNFPTRQPLIVDPTRQTINAFLNYVRSRNIRSSKPAGSFSGLEGLDGFLKSIWGGIKKVVGTAVGVVGRKIGILPGAGAAPQQIIVRPTVSVPQLPRGLVQTQVTPAAAQAGVGAMFQNPMFLAMLGLGLVFALKK